MLAAIMAGVEIFPFYRVVEQASRLFELFVLAAIRCFSTSMHNRDDCAAYRDRQNSPRSGRINFTSFRRKGDPAIFVDFCNFFRGGNEIERKTADAGVQAVAVGVQALACALVG